MIQLCVGRVIRGDTCGWGVTQGVWAGGWVVQGDSCCWVGGTGECVCVCGRGGVGGGGGGIQGCVEGGAGGG